MPMSRGRKTEHVYAVGSSTSCCLPLFSFKDKSKKEIPGHQGIAMSQRGFPKRQGTFLIPRQVKSLIKSRYYIQQKSSLSNGHSQNRPNILGDRGLYCLSTKTWAPTFCGLCVQIDFLSLPNPRPWKKLEATVESNYNFFVLFGGTKWVQTKE